MTSEPFCSYSLWRHTTNTTVPKNYQTCHGWTVFSIRIFFCLKCFDFWAIYGGIILDWPTFRSFCSNKTNNNYHVLNHVIIQINDNHFVGIVAKWDYSEYFETMCTYTIKSLKSHSNNVDLLLFVRALCTLRTYCCFASKYCISCDLRAGIFFLESWCSWSPSCKEKDAHWNNRV